MVTLSINQCHPSHVGSMGLFHTARLATYKCSSQFFSVLLYGRFPLSDNLQVSEYKFFLNDNFFCAMLKIHISIENMELQYILVNTFNIGNIYTYIDTVWVYAIRYQGNIPHSHHSKIKMALVVHPDLSHSDLCND